MDDKQVKLAVNNLVISFRTSNGLVQAVRDISFNLYEGETLAIVGESGSGKSVTTRAVSGLLSSNAVKVGGQIIYDGQDLMKISEERFNSIRGDKISMIFQDPLSSLNPIMRIGKQMTEAMLVKSKLRRRNARKNFNFTLSRLNACMDEVYGKDNVAARARNKEMCKNFDKFEVKHLELENSFNTATECAKDALSDIDDLLFEMEKNAVTDFDGQISEITNLSLGSVERYVVCCRAEELRELVYRLKKLAEQPLIKKIPLFEKCRKHTLKLFKRGAVGDKTDFSAAKSLLEKLREILKEALQYDTPNFFAMGYYLVFSGQPLPEMGVQELNVFLRRYLDENFMLDFIDRAEAALKYSHMRCAELKKAAVEIIDDFLHILDKDNISCSQMRAAEKRICSAVEKAIDRLEIKKDNTAYTFCTSMREAVKIYFGAIKHNKREKKRYDRQKKLYGIKQAKGVASDWQVADKNLVDRAAAKEEIRKLSLRIRHNFSTRMSQGDTDFKKQAVELIDYLKETASQVAHKMSNRAAKMRALKLLEEVGIPQPRKRVRQYPFEFSGGMRQRIVIAIALSSDPDILICDEPTTALDVTIQAQILELINKVKEQRKLSVIFITHDLGVVANMADRVAVMYAGKIAEIGKAEEIFYEPAHPYTWALLSSMPDLNTKGRLEAIPGTPPDMIYPPKGDAFAGRNKYALKIDFEMQPPLFKISESHYAATWLLHPNAPKVEPPDAVIRRISQMRKAGGGERNGK